VPTFRLLFDGTSRMLYEACWDGMVIYDLWSGIVRADARYPKGIGLPEIRLTDDHRVLISSPEGRWIWDPVENRWAEEPWVISQTSVPDLHVPAGPLVWVRSTLGDAAYVQIPSLEEIVIEPGSGGAIQICSGHKMRVTCAAFSPDNRRLVSGSEDTTVRIWRVSSGELLLTLREHEATIDEVAFSPDGRWLVSVDQNGHMVVRDTVPKSEARHVARHAIAAVNRMADLLDEEGTTMGALTRLDHDTKMGAQALREARDLARCLGDSADSLNRRAWN
jgi:WD40 repeat protein